MELTAAHQYQLHASVLDDWGMDRLAMKMRQEMQEEIGHSDDYIARIMFLNGEHMTWLELQLDPVKRMGEPAYIAKHISAPGEDEG